MRSFRKAFYLAFASFALNSGVSLLCYYFKGIPEFRGYFIATVLCFVLSCIWLLSAYRGMKTNTMMLLALTMGGFPVRLMVFAFFVYVGFYFFGMNRTYFAAGFLIGTIISLIVEVWFFNVIRIEDKK